MSEIKRDLRRVMEKKFGKGKVLVLIEPPQALRLTTDFCFAKVAQTNLLLMFQSQKLNFIRIAFKAWDFLQKKCLKQKKPLEATFL